MMTMTINIILSFLIALLGGTALSAFVSAIFQKIIGTITKISWIKIIFAGIAVGFLKTWFARFVFLLIAKEFNWQYLAAIALVTFFFQLRPEYNTSPGVIRNGYIISIGTFIGFLLGYLYFLQ